MEKIAFKGTEGINFTLEDDRKAQLRRQEEIVNNMTTIEDMLGIVKKNKDYFLAGSTPQKAMATAAMATAKTAGSILGAVQRWFRYDKMSNEDKKRLDEGPQTDKEFMTQRGSKLTDVMTQMKLQEYRKQTAESDFEAGEAERMLRGLEEQKADLLFGFETIEGNFIPAVDEAARKEITLFEESRARHKERVEEKPSVPDPLSVLLANKDSSGNAQDATDTMSSQSIVGSPAILTGAEPVQDFKALTGGVALLSKGDVIVDWTNLSKGIMGEKGDFVDFAIGKLKGVGGGSSTVTIPVNISIGSVDGDPEKFLKSIQPAIEQSFERMYYERQKRG